MAVTIVLARPEQAAGIAQVHIQSWRQAYHGLLPQTLLDGLNLEIRTRQWREWLETPGSPQTFVALQTQPGSPEEALGFVSGGPIREPQQDFDCEIAAIYLLPEAQGTGLGKRLFHHMQNVLAQAGYRQMLVWVLKENLQARGFYERLGGKLALEKTAQIGAASGQAIDVSEIGYGYSLAKNHAQA